MPNKFNNPDVKPTTKDYAYCEDCKMFFDLWKYGNIEDAGHKDCNWRYVTEEELKVLVKECEKEGCFEEDML